VKQDDGERARGNHENQSLPEGLGRGEHSVVVLEMIDPAGAVENRNSGG